MKYKNLTRYGGTVVFTDYPIASTDVNLTLHTGTLSETSFRIVADTPPVKFVYPPNERSPYALPFEHKAWDAFDKLLAKLDEQSDVDNDLTEDWYKHLRRGSSTQ